VEDGRLHKKSWGAENVKEAHTPAQESLDAWGVVNNSGDIQRVSTQRGIITVKQLDKLLI